MSTTAVTDTPKGDTLILVAEDQPQGAAQAGGHTSVGGNVVEVIAGIAAREVAGVYQIGKGRLRGAFARVAGTKETSHGVSAEVGKREIAADLEMIVEYGYNLFQVAERVRAIVIRRLEEMTALTVKEVNIHVMDVHYTPDGPPPPRRVQ
ncbi:MAG: Asp23/Gls24 family envelope stress response protein [Deltaproteobacteria bacterium HGW-Deltaproteobacteria-14]|jgi:uncharacterized alkaline shock family protein YloU|nr:MAG: Asp23/Gls24 family envelope stress response protein [Deltaproteobacteria bacterium HGW-Deltaproteobacteria-14]